MKNHFWCTGSTNSFQPSSFETEQDYHNHFVFSTIILIIIITIIMVVNISSCRIIITITVLIIITNTILIIINPLITETVAT